MSGFYRERDDEGPWCQCCRLAIRDDEEYWPDGVCPGCQELMPDQDEDEEPMTLTEHCREEVQSDLFRWIK